MLPATVTPARGFAQMRLRPRDTSWTLMLLAVGSALVVTLILAGTRLLVPSEQADIPSSAWVWTHDGVLVEPLGPNEPFHYGDEVVAVNGVPLEAWAANAFRLPWTARATSPDAAPNPRDMVRFDVRRDGQIVGVEAPRVTLSPDRVGGAPIGVVVFGGGVLVLALIFVARRPRVMALRLLLVAAAAWPTSSPGSSTSSRPTWRSRRHISSPSAPRLSSTSSSGRRSPTSS
jgi:hypothetical protein